MGTASGWVGETAGRPPTGSPQLALLSFPAGEVYAMPAVTQRLLDDSPVNLAQFLEGEISKEFGEKEGSAFLTGDGTLPKDIMPDFLHPQGTGYRIWAEAMESHISKLRKKLRKRLGFDPIDSKRFLGYCIDWQ